MHISIVPETLFHIGSFGVTNTLFTSWVVVLALCLLAVWFRSRLRAAPGKVQSGVELALESLLGFLTTVAGDRAKAEKFFGIAATIFFFVLLSNWAGILPGVGSIGLHEIANGKDIFVPLFRSVYSDLNMTLALAIFVVFVSHIFGFLAVGVRHLSNFFTLRDFGSSFSGILEFVGEFSKMLSLGFRLFGNIFAGEVLLVIIGGLVPFIAPVPFLGLELFVGLIQALIFSTLAMLSFATWTKEHVHPNEGRAH